MTSICYWKDKSKKTINPKLFSTEAEKLAKDVASDNERSNKVNKRTQLRKFYDEVLRLNTLSRSNPGDWDNILPYVQMLTAKVAYAKGRDLVSNNFLNFMKSGIEQVEDQDDLAVFSNFFEAFMGFYKQHGPSN
ncbi:MAG: type III-A CRISPR-associated protein Csm2 [Desulfobacterium sp.]|nr:type III-A CRISPR-associated protein Csm2 [Desulfobacterium sp.]